MEVVCHLPEDPTELMVISDVVLCTEGKEFPVHSQVLAAYSGFFRSMLHDLKHPVASTSASAGCSKGSHSEGCCGNRSRMQLDIKDVSAKELGLLLKYLYTQDTSLLRKIDDLKTLVDLAQRFDIPSIIRNCVPWVTRNATDLVLNAHAAHFDAVYWLNLAEAWGFQPLQVSCMAAIADEIAFYSVGEGEYWSSFDLNRAQSISAKVLFIIARAVAEASSRQVFKRDVRDRLAELERIIARIMEQSSRSTAQHGQQLSQQQTMLRPDAGMAPPRPPPPPAALPGGGSSSSSSSSYQRSAVERSGSASRSYGRPRSPSTPKRQQGMKGY